MKLGFQLDTVAAEKMAAVMIEALGVPSFLLVEIGRGNGAIVSRRKLSFSFIYRLSVCALDPARDRRVEVSKILGIAYFVGNQRGSLPVPNHEI
jgi:hypothetical protein